MAGPTATEKGPPAPAGEPASSGRMEGPPGSGQMASGRSPPWGAAASGRIDYAAIFVPILYILIIIKIINSYFITYTEHNYYIFILEFIVFCIVS
jgi:hypothetical protein